MTGPARPHPRSRPDNQTLAVYSTGGTPDLLLLLSHRCHHDLPQDEVQRFLEPSQFTSRAFTRRALDSGLVPSMGAVGDCSDNGMIESFGSRMQVELLDTRRWRTRVELANAIFEYLETWHNRRRRHSSIGMLTPDEFETRHRTITAA